MAEPFLYNLTLRRPTHAPISIVGSFTGSKKKQDILCANGTNIQLLKQDLESGALSSVCQQDLWAEVAQMKLLRLPGSQIDVVVITSDSGKLVVLKFDPESSKFYPIIQEPYTKTGFRRISPGSHLAVDPMGRSVMISAIERNKICYPFALTDPLALSLPLESINEGYLTLALAALETGYDNPLFVAIEIDTSPFKGSNHFDESKTPLMLNFYEFDQALNHVVKRKQLEHFVPASASSLIPLPDGDFLVCCDGYFIFEYKSKDDAVFTKHVVTIPQLQHANSQTNSMNRPVCSAVYKMKKNSFFVLVQTTSGHLYKVTVVAKNGSKTARVTYFDSIPLCQLINVLRSGYLYANTTVGDNIIYQFESLGEDEDALTNYLNEVADGDLNESKSEALETLVSSSSSFVERDLVNLSLAHTSVSLAPLFGGKLLGSDGLQSKKLATFSSKIRLLSHGLPTNTLVSAPLPISPVSIYTSKINSESMNDDYLVISSTSLTLVLSIGEVVEEVTDSHFVSNQPTIAVRQIGRSSVAQVYPHGVRHVRRVKKILENREEFVDVVETDWYPPAGISIVGASFNLSQLVLALSNREVCYFEVSSDDDTLLEYQDRSEMPAQITSIAIPPENNSKICVLGCSDETILVLLLDRANCLSIVTMQALSSRANSLLILSISGKFFVHIGMQNGLYVRSSIDKDNGKLSDTRTRYLGSKPIILSSLGGQNVLAISSKPWICNGDSSKFKLTPLSGVSVSFGASFYSEDIGGEGIVGISQEELVIFIPENEVDDFIVEDIEVGGEARKFVEDDGIAYVVSRTAEQNSLVKVNLETKDVTKEFSFTERVTSLAVVQFNSHANRKHLVVGTALPNCIYTFRLPSVEFLNKTNVEYVPSAMCSFNGRLLVGMNNLLRLYDMGQKQLLRKAQHEVMFFKVINQVMPLQDGQKHVLLASDISLLVSAFYFDPESNKFSGMADDIIKRHVTTILPLDPQTVAGGDKFGNLFVLRLDNSTLNETDISSNFGETTYLNGLTLRFSYVCNFHLADIPTSLSKGCLNVDGVDLVVYTGLQGSVGILTPMATRSEIEFFTKLELALRAYFNFNFDDFKKTENGYNLLGRDHMKFRGYYNPCINVVDGDLIERFSELNHLAKVKIAGQFDRTPAEIEKRIEDMRNRGAF